MTPLRFAGEDNGGAGGRAPLPHDIVGHASRVESGLNELLFHLERSADFAPIGGTLEKRGIRPSGKVGCVNIASRNAV